MCVCVCNDVDSGIYTWLRMSPSEELRVASELLEKERAWLMPKDIDKSHESIELDIQHSSL